jgi:hypothetical protein
MNPGDVNAGSPSPSRYVPYDDPNAALWASITPPSDSTLSTQVRRRFAAFSPDMLAHRLRLALPGIFRSHATAFYAVLGGAMALGASAGLLGFAAADALTAESSAATAATASSLRAEPAAAGSVMRETPSLRPAVPAMARVAGSPAPGGDTARSDTARSAAAEQTLAAVTPAAAMDDVDSPPPPRAKRQRATSSKLAKRKAKRAHAFKKRAPSRRRDATPRTRNEKARALARALGS